MQAFVLSPDPASEYFMEEGCFILENSNSEADPGLSIARARVRPGTGTRTHYLRGVTERYLMLEGTGVVYVGDLPPTTVQPGDVVVIPPGVPQRIDNTGSTDLVFYVLCSPRFSPEVYVEV